MRAQRITGIIGYATIICVAEPTPLERRLAQIPTEHHRRESDCEAGPTGCCKVCDRPMNETERHIYRAL